MNNLLKQVGKVCKKGNTVGIYKSAAGYYVGTFDDQGPYCRLSCYYGKTKNDPVMNQMRSFSMEIEYCSSGNCEFHEE